jgi:NADH-quinone oxidoreductase subunit G
VQSFQGTVKPLGDARPAWKVLRVLGNLLSLEGFDYETSEAVRDEALGSAEEIAEHLNNHFVGVPETTNFVIDSSAGMLERVSDVPIYFADPIVRRAASLQKTSDAKAPKALMSANMMEQRGLVAGDKVKITQGVGSVVLEMALDKRLPYGVVRIAAAHPSTAGLGAMFGPIQVEKAAVSAVSTATGEGA